MSDIVVTMPLGFKYGGLKGLEAWISEGDAAGDPETGSDYCFSVAGGRPHIQRGERVYIVHNKHLIGYAPLTELDDINDNGRYWGLWREGGAIAMTTDEEIIGFRGWRYRWWERNDERPFPDWKSVGMQAKAKQPLPTLFPKGP